MKRKLTTAVPVLIWLLMASGCGQHKAILQVNDSPITARKADVTLEEIERAIIAAGAELDWKMKSVSPGHLEATVDVRHHRAVVDITFDTKTFDILYKDSVALDYDGQRIHRNYNRWIANLDKKIRQRLQLL